MKLNEMAQASIKTMEKLGFYWGGPCFNENDPRWMGVTDIDGDAYLIIVGRDDGGSYWFAEAYDLFDLEATVDGWTDDNDPQTALDGLIESLKKRAEDFHKRDFRKATSEWVCTDPDTHQWQRKVGDTYEMYQVQPPLPYADNKYWFAGGGTFKLTDYSEDDIEWTLKTFGYEPGEASEAVTAECLFECNFADFDIESFDTEAEAIEYVNKLKGE